MSRIVTTEWQRAAEVALNASIEQLQPVSGGDFASAWRADLADGRTVFLKTHSEPPPHHFTTEANGLRWLHEANAVAVPEVLAASDKPPFLAMRWIDTGQGSVGDEAAFGRSLAQLHQAGAATFGRVDERSTGSLGLPNAPCDTFVEFLLIRRWQPLLVIAAERAALAPPLIDAIDALGDRLADIAGPIEPSARLHGDLWAGNRLVDRTGQSWLIDPAAHGGNREADLAMMRLFGGYGDAAFAAYDEAFPLAEGWQERVPLHQLAPLIVHAIKFGGGYADAVSAAVRHYR